MSPNTRQPEVFSIPSIISVICAIGSFMTGAFWGMVLAGLAILFGILGGILALSPKIRGGFLSTLAIILGSVGVIAAIVKLFARLMS